MTGVKPDFDSSTNTLKIPDLEGVEYRIGGQLVEGEVKIDKNTTVLRSAKPGFELAKGAETVFKFVVAKDESKPAEKPADEPVKVEDPAEPVVSNTAGNTPQAPGQTSGRAVPGPSPR